MRRINIAEKTEAGKGEIATYWFENPSIGLKNTLLYQVIIPLSPFDSGLDYEAQLVETEIMFEWLEDEDIQLKSAEIFSFPNEQNDLFECSLYLGHAHNYCEVKSLEIRRKANLEFEVLGKIIIDFEREGVGLGTEEFIVNTELIEVSIKENISNDG